MDYTVSYYDTSDMNYLQIYTMTILSKILPHTQLFLLISRINRTRYIIFVFSVVNTLEIRIKKLIITFTLVLH